MRQEDERRVQEQIDAGERPPEALSDLPLPRLSYVSDDLLYLLTSLYTLSCKTSFSIAADKS
jgi:hypothetical protein